MNKRKLIIFLFLNLLFGFTNNINSMWLPIGGSSIKSIISKNAKSLVKSDIGQAAIYTAGFLSFLFILKKIFIKIDEINPGNEKEINDLNMQVKALQNELDEKHINEAFFYDFLSKYYKTLDNSGKQKFIEVFKDYTPIIHDFPVVTKRKNGNLYEAYED